MNEQTENIKQSDGDDHTPNTLEESLDVYPLRHPSEDPRWAVRTIWTWVGMAVFLLLFIVVLIILGIWYD